MRKTPRSIAVAALMRVENNGFSNLVMKDIFDGKTDARDRAFCSAVVYGTLSRIVTLDFVLQSCLQKPLAKLDPEIRAILRSGLFQLKYLNSVSDFAAVDESVKLAKVFGKSSAAGLVNAVLRRSASLDAEALAADLPQREKLSVLYSADVSVVDLLCEQYPEKAEEILSATLCAPRCHLRVNTLKTDADGALSALKAQGISAEKGSVSGSLVADSAAGITSSMAFEDGLIRIQGIWSQYAVAALGARAGDTVFDVCAAPGGKSLSAAQDMGNAGRVLAMDISESRLALIGDAARREGVKIVETKQNDATVFDSDLGEADRVLCDVPCSNLGMMASKPELRSRPIANGELTAIQYDILCASARYVKKGGRLVYSTCTVDKRENSGVVDRFLARQPSFRVVEREDGSRYAEFLPDLTDNSGFFVACLERMW